ncbi:MAG: hypothetical protein PWQ20_36 [Thermotogaceae bacterium]|jgi:uncharacterized phosphosugar-binding protein|nr:hypothetical protein [Thermotogaceae bacterium]MDN5336966.1 hypothetical protein [Thermotogaceae bacterium]
MILSAFETYIKRLQEILEKIKNDQKEKIVRVSNLMAECISNDGIVHFFGSGHSILPVMDVFPRYGSFIGLNPLIDPRLMWFSATGPASAPGLLLVERKENYVADGFLRYQPIKSGDILVVYSHGGLNAAPIEAALYGKKVGTTVIAITSMTNQNISRPTHSSGKKLSDIADITIDNCVPPEDALIALEGRKEKVAAVSTIAAMAITMSLIAETAFILNNKGKELKIFVSPNVEGFGVDYNLKVFDEYQRVIRNHYD